MNKKSKITGIAHYVPERVVSNDEMAKKYGTITAEKIFEKTGILERRWSDELTTVGMATECVNRLLKKLGVRADEVDCILIGTLTPDFFFPSTAVAVIKNVCAVNAYGYDIVAACPSFLFGVEQADMMIRIGKAKKVIVCGVDRMSKTVNSFEHKTGVLFGDAAAAILIEPCLENEIGINACYSRVVADDLEDIYFKTRFSSDGLEDEKFNLQGGNVYKNGVGLTVQVINEFLTKNSVSINDFNYIVPHQANMNMISQVAEKLGVPIEKFLMNIRLMGNTAGASVPLCLSQKIDEGIIKKGDRLLLVSFGAGYTLSITDTYI